MSQGLCKNTLITQTVNNLSEVCVRVLTGVDPDAALRAANEEAASIFLQMRCDELLLTLRVLLCGGGETHLWDQRFGPHPPPSHHDRTVYAVGTFSLTAQTWSLQHCATSHILLSIWTFPSTTTALQDTYYRVYFACILPIQVIILHNLCWYLCIYCSA